MTSIKNTPMDFSSLKVSLSADGFIDLEQDIGNGDSHFVRLHPLQVRFIAELMGLLPTSRARARRPSYRRLTFEAVTCTLKVGVQRSTFQTRYRLWDEKIMYRSLYSVCNRHKSKTA